MAIRLATCFKDILLNVELSRMNELIDIFRQARAEMEIHHCYNGDKECWLRDTPRLVALRLKNRGSSFQASGSLTVYNWAPAYALQRSLMRFKGDAVCQRFFRGMVIEYRYVNGGVISITEIKGKKREIIYTSPLALSFQSAQESTAQIKAKSDLEREIQLIRAEIDALLDQRLKAEGHRLSDIDQQLKAKRDRLLMLKA